MTVAWFVCAAVAAAAPRATTTCGTYEGVWESVTTSAGDASVAAFKGIRYGAPPVGERRWAPPVAAECAGGLVNATQSGNICWQFDGVVRGWGGTQDEDCLFAEVRTPSADPTSKLPVVVWIHGGSLVLGAGTEGMFPGQAFLAAEGGVVVVSLQYRLGALGFLALPSLEYGSPLRTSGNYGFLDQVLGLQWVKDNVGAFGGDPTRVSVWGQSSGGTSIFALLAMPSAEGLFTSAVSLSGSPNITIDREAAYEQNAAALHQVKSECASLSHSDQAKCLRALSARSATGLFPEPFSVNPTPPDSPAGPAYPGLPVVDGVVIVSTPEDALRQGLVPATLIISNTEAEMDVFSNNETIDSMSAAQYRSFLKTDTFRKWPAGTSDIVADLYSAEIQQSRELAWQKMQADYSMTCGNLALGRAAAAAPPGRRRPVYITYVSQPPSHLLYGVMGPPTRFAAHVWDYMAGARAWDLFNRWAGSPVYVPTDDDVALGDMLRDPWMQVTHSGSTVLLPEFGEDEVVGVYRNGCIERTPGHAVHRCNTLAAPPVGLDKRFWCVN